MRRAYLILFKRKPFQRRFERAFGERTWTAYHAVRNLSFAVDRVARHFRDSSWPLYPELNLHPDESDDIDESELEASADAADADAPAITPRAAR